MAHIELSLENSNFIKQYVAQHKQELEDLRAKVNALEFIGQWFIIGDHEYRHKRRQYATTSFAEAEVSPRIILYPIKRRYQEGDGPVSRS